MKDKTTTKKDFDCVQFVRDIRDQSSEQLFQMSPEEVVAYFKKASENSTLRQKS